VEEVSFRAPSIEGVGTTTTAFVGPTLTGPVGGMPYGGLPPTGAPVAGSPSGGIPELLTSFGDFQNIYGGFDDLALSNPGDPKNRNYMAMAVKAFFDNGGAMLYVSRVFANKATGGTIDPGVASSGAPAATNIVAAARFPGSFGNSNFFGPAVPVTVTLNYGKIQQVANLPFGSLLAVPPAAAGTAPTLYSNGGTSQFESNAATPAPLPSPLPSNLYLLTVKVLAMGANGQQMVFDNLGLDSNHPSYIGSVLSSNPPRHIDALQNQIYFIIGSGLNTAPALYAALFGTTWVDPSVKPVPPAKPAPIPSQSFTLTGGNDGAEPTANDYTSPLRYCEPLEDIAIVATPGASIYTDSINIMIGGLIPHVERQRAYRVAILEAGPNLLDSDYENVRAQIDSIYSALYVPWVVTPNPLAKSGTSIPAEIAVPPSGFMAGIYARNDTQNSRQKRLRTRLFSGQLTLNATSPLPNKVYSIPWESIAFVSSPTVVTACGEHEQRALTQS